MAVYPLVKLPVIGLGPTLVHCHSHFNLSTSARPPFPDKVIFTDFGDIIQPSTVSNRNPKFPCVKLSPCSSCTIVVPHFKCLQLILFVVWAQNLGSILMPHFFNIHYFLDVLLQTLSRVPCGPKPIPRPG